MHERLFTDLVIKNHTLKNRILFCGPVTGFAHENAPTDRLQSYYVERAKGGAGLIELELGLAYRESALAEWAELAELVHAYGAKLIAALEYPSHCETMQVVRRAGLDGVALHRGPEATKAELWRELDKWNRGGEFLIGLHMTGDMDSDECAHGADYLVVHGDGSGAFRQKGTCMAACVEYPDPLHCEALLEQGQFQLVGLSRQLVCDPFWPAKAELGNDHVIRHWDWLEERNDIPSPWIRCALNPYLGHEGNHSESAMPPATLAKTVAVVGGGPAGMQAAIAASKRGHDVMLWEPEAELGGSLLTQQRREAARWLVEEMRRNHVDVRVGIPVTVEHIAAIRPDVVILATTDARKKALAPPLRCKQIPALDVNDCQPSIGQAVRNGFHVAVGI